MKNVFLAVFALTTLSTTVFAKSSVETIVADCTKQTAYLNDETNKPETTISKFIIESRILTSNDKKEETEIYKYLLSMTDGELNDVSAESGTSKIKYEQISENSKRIVISDSYEYNSFDDNGNETVEKGSAELDSVWETIEKSDTKEVSLRTSYSVDGSASNEKVVRTKIILSDKEWTLDTITINPQEVKRGDRQLLFSSKSCRFNRK